MQFFGTVANKLMSTDTHRSGEPDKGLRVLHPRPEIWVSVVLIAITLAVFLFACANEFVNYDDNLYVFNNPYVQSGLTVRSILWTFRFDPTTANWHPLTWLSLELDYQLYGLRPWGYHLTNVLLHTANVLLLFAALSRLTRQVWCSAFVAALFAVHPLHVESVAWVSERKDVLSTFFWMLTLLAYTFYVERRTVTRYLLMVLAFALGLAAKPMLVTLPFTLLLLDYWPLQRLRAGNHTRHKGRRAPNQAILSCIYEKLPLFVLAGASCVLTWLAQQQGQAIIAFNALPFAARLANAVSAYADYLVKTLWPFRVEQLSSGGFSLDTNLAAFYPHAGVGYSAQYAMLASLVLAGISIVAILSSRRLPYLIVGWLWYLGTLVPVIGLVQVGFQGMADRYTYVPLIGVFVLVVWGVADLGRWWQRQRVAIFSGTCLIIVYMLYSLLQVSYWHDSVALWEHTIKVTKDNAYAHDGLGGAIVKQAEGERDPKERAKKWEQAVEQYRQAVKINPGFLKARNNLAGALMAHAAALMALGRAEDVQEADRRLQEAEGMYRHLLRLLPNDASQHCKLGNVLKVQKKHDEAADQFRQALYLDPNVVRDPPDREGLARYLFNYGRTLAQQGKPDRAVEYLRLAVNLQPGNAEYRQVLRLREQRPPFANERAPVAPAR
jgi:tetratricopeptide (TPR) repeat protein